MTGEGGGREECEGEGGGEREGGGEGGEGRATNIISKERRRREKTKTKPNRKRNVMTPRIPYSLFDDVIR